jgi:hypothetical protein
LSGSLEFAVIYCKQMRCGRICFRQILRNATRSRRNWHFSSWNICDALRLLTNSTCALAVCWDYDVRSLSCNIKSRWGILMADSDQQVLIWPTMEALNIRLQCQCIVTILHTSVQFGIVSIQTDPSRNGYVIGQIVNVHRAGEGSQQWTLWDSGCYR